VLKRRLFFLAILLTPVVWFAVRRPVVLSFAGIAAAGAWWSASPVSYPRWIAHGLVRAVPLAVVESLALWWLSR
jgi:hypothetical protein